MNRLIGLANSLGLGLEETFYIESEGVRFQGVYKFTESELKSFGKWETGRWETDDEPLRLLLNGKARVERLACELC